MSESVQIDPSKNSLTSLQHQVDMFTLLDDESNTARYSNGFIDFDTAPRYYRGQVKSIPLNELDSTYLQNTYYRDGVLHTVKIAGTQITEFDDEGKKVEKITWPSNREERIERAILKMASDGHLSSRKDSSGSHDLFFVTFSMYKLHKEIKKVGKMDYANMEAGLKILTETVITITSEDEKSQKVYSGTFFPQSFRVKQTTGQKTELVCLQLTSMHAKAISNGTYRQYLYSRAAKYKRAMSRFLDTYLIHEWKNAGVSKMHTKKTLKMSEILSGFGYRENSRNPITSNRDVKATLKELANTKDSAGNNASILEYAPQAVACEWDENGKAIDYEYTLTASQYFVSQQKQSNGKTKGLNLLRHQHLVEENKI